MDKSLLPGVSPLSVSPSQIIQDKTLQVTMAEKGKGRRKGKVEMRRMENPKRRQITFSKRKAGLFKKAAELSLLCDVDLALIISSPSGKLYHSPAPKHMNGEGLECLSFEEIQHLEQQMKIGATKIRLKKEKLLQKDIRFLKTKLKRREVGTDDNDLEGALINEAVGDHINETVDDRQHAHERDGGANGVARPQTNLQYYKNLSLSLC